MDLAQRAVDDWPGSALECGIVAVVPPGGECMSLRKVGFFKELPHGESDGPALHESIDASPQEDEDRIVRYLVDGNVLATSPMTTTDVLAPTTRVIGTLQIKTDGTWEWPSDLAYYVEVHHVRLPPEFVHHMAMRGWEPLPMSERDLVALLEANSD
jgi:hypothetical protein